MRRTVQPVSTGLLSVVVQMRCAREEGANQDEWSEDKSGTDGRVSIPVANNNRTLSKESSQGRCEMARERVDEPRPHNATRRASLHVGGSGGVSLGVRKHALHDMPLYIMYLRAISNPAREPSRKGNVRRRPLTFSASGSGRKTLSAASD